MYVCICESLEYVKFRQIYTHVYSKITTKCQKILTLHAFRIQHMYVGSREDYLLLAVLLDTIIPPASGFRQ